MYNLHTKMQTSPQNGKENFSRMDLSSLKISDKVVLTVLPPCAPPSKRIAFSECLTGRPNNVSDMSTSLLPFSTEVT